MRKFLGQISRGHPGVIRADIPAQNFGQGAQDPGKKRAFRARRSMTRRRNMSTTLRDSQKLRSEKRWAEFSLPIESCDVGDLFFVNTLYLQEHVNVDMQFLCVSGAKQSTSPRRCMECVSFFLLRNGRILLVFDTVGWSSLP